MCRGDHRKERDDRALDVNGNHAAGNCPSAARARYSLHSKINLAFANAGKAAGCVVSMEPSTSSVLLDKYPAEVCKVIAPKRKSKAAMASATMASLVLGRACERGVGPTMEELRGLASLVEGGGPTGESAARRVDVSFTDCQGREMFMDASAIHTTCSSRLGSAMRFALEAEQADMAAAAEGTLDPMQSAASTPIVAAQQAKVDHYQPLMNLIKLQSLRHERPKGPEFFGCIVSHSGEMSPHVFLAVAWLTRAYKLSLKKAGPRRDGRTARQLTARFRRRLKDNITAALAWGFGLMLISAGGVNPRGGRDDLAW